MCPISKNGKSDRAKFQELPIYQVQNLPFFKNYKILKIIFSIPTKFDQEILHKMVNS